MEKEITILDILNDPNNIDQIILDDGEGNDIYFEQVATIPYNGVTYCMLKPVSELEGIGEEEGIIFYVDETDPNDPILLVEEDENKASLVYNEYLKMCEEEFGE